MKALILVFSPNGNGSRISEELYAQMKPWSAPRIVDITSPEARRAALEETFEGDHLFVVAPVYFRGLPDIVDRFLRKSSLRFRKGSLLLSYGNVGEGSALRQAKRVLERKGIPLVSAAVIPAPHAYRHGVTGYPLHFKPSKMHFAHFVECSLAKAGAEAIRLTDYKYAPMRIFPQKTLARLEICAPEIDRKSCMDCRLCKQVCPVGAIDDDLNIRRSVCVRCGACVNCCEFSARTLRFRFPEITPRRLSRRIARKGALTIYV